MAKGKPQGNNIRIEIHKSAFSAVEQIDAKDNQIEKATVLEVGEDVSGIKKGDTVLFKAYNLDTIEVDNETFNIIPAEDVKYLWHTSTTSKK